jgi:hypothetical protein
VSDPIAPGMPVGSTRLTGDGIPGEEPLTVEDWRIIHRAYFGFITIVRQVVKDARAREANGQTHAKPTADQAS